MGARGLGRIAAAGAPKLWRIAAVGAPKLGRIAAVGAPKLWRIAAVGAPKLWRIAAVGALLSCSSHKDPVIRIDAFDRRPERPEALDLKAMERAAAEALGDARHFRFRHAKPKERRWQLSLEITQWTEWGAEKDPVHRARRSVGLDARMRAIDPEGGKPFPGGGLEESVLLVREEPRDTPPTRLARDAVVAALKQLELRYALMGAEPAEVIAALEGGDEKALLRALAVVELRRLDAAIPALRRLLTKTDPAPVVVLAALRALVGMRSPRAVPALIEATRGRPAVVSVPILYAVAEAGGDQAKAYLFTLAQGHPDPGMRAEAARALKELEAREGPTEAASPKRP